MIQLGRILALFLVGAVAGASPFRNLADIMSRQGFSGAYETHRSLGRVKLAILDNGFLNYKKELGTTLPANTIYHAGPVALSQPEESHGLVMAQLVTALLHEKFPVELHLYQSFGYTNFASAVDDAIKNKVDVVLYAQVWEYGGNNDGRGFINQIVNKAVSAGIIWINSAGNFAENTFNSAVDVGGEGWLNLPGPNQSVQVRCLADARKSCKLRVVLSWNDFKDDVNLGTNKDLDLVLTDDLLNIVQTSALVQKENLSEDIAGFSKYPREIIEATIEPGVYLVRVKARSQNFSKVKDTLRITTSGDLIEMVQRSTGESLLGPADNSGVITVGASDTEKSSYSEKINKPDIFAPSLIVISDSEQYKGTSQSAAIVAAGAAILKSFYQGLDKDKFLELARFTASSGPYPVGSGFALSTFQFSYTGPGCFEPVMVPFVPQPLTLFLQNGGVIVLTTRGVKVFLNRDPLDFFSGLRRLRQDDMIVVGPEGGYVLARTQEGAIPPNTYEIVQSPADQIICGLTNLHPKLFRLSGF